MSDYIEINFATATFDDIAKFTQNLLLLRKSDQPQDWDSKISYYSTQVQGLIARKSSESAASLATEIDQARAGVTRGLEKLTNAIEEASKQAQAASESAEAQSKQMVRATWGLVVVTGLLVLATGALVFYTQALTQTPPTVITLPPSS